MLPVLETQVLGDGVQDLHLGPQLSLGVHVGHPQAGGVLRDVADLDLGGARGGTCGGRATVTL